MNVASPAPQMKRDWLDWPFFGESHRAFAGALDRFVASGAIAAIDHDDVDRSCRKLVRALGAAGLLDVAVAPLDGDASAIDSRSVCLARETLAYHDGLADFAFAMQGLGSGAVAIAGSDEQRRLVLPRVRSGEWLAAFALSEKEAGSDVAAMACSAREDGNGYRLDGEKTWISNGGIADVYTLFARTGEAPGARGISAFLVFPDDLGFSIAERIEIMAPHPLATLRFDGCVYRRIGGSAPPETASRSPCARSTSSAPQSQPRRSASLGARSMRRLRMQRAEKCLARRSLTFSSLRRRSARWRRISMRRRC